MYKTALAPIIIFVLLVSTWAGIELVSPAEANPYPYTNCDSSFVTVSIVSPENRTYNTNVIQLTITAGGYPGVWYVSYSLDDKPSVEVAPGHPLGHTFNESVRLNPLPKGSHSIVVEAIAMANNPEGKVTAQTQVYFTVAKETQPSDTSAPEITILSPQNKTYYATEIPLEFSVNEPNCSVSYKFDGQEPVEISQNTTLTGFYYGSHNVTVYATDVAGNLGVQTVGFAFAKTEEHTPSLEPFPASLVFMAFVGIALGVVGLLVYLKKRQR